MLRFSLCLILLVGSTLNIEASRILAIYPCPSISHQIVFRPLTLELLKLGHEMTVVTTDPMFSKENAPANLTEINVHDATYDVIRKIISNVVTGSKSDVLNQAIVVKELIYKATEAILLTNEVQHILKNEKRYDLIFIEALFTPMLGISHKFKAPTILISSFGPFIGSYEIVGAPTKALLYHNMYSQRLNNLTLYEKISELYNYIRIQYIFNHSDEKFNELLKRIFGSDTPTLSELKNYVDMLFVNIHQIWEGNYPVPPTVVHMGGLHQKPQKSLPKDLQQYLDASENGVIYFSFGTNVNISHLPQEKIMIFKNVLSELPYNVLWKIKDDYLPEESKNIKTFQWLPQADLLRHPNVKIFITQGGLQSTDEAITAGVPLIGVPILGDQCYRDNVKRLRTLMQDQPQTPLERAVWWTEYVLRNGGAKHLRAPAANLSWTEWQTSEWPPEIAEIAK
ncbi:Ecdysteroid UDP-glucosyltransferase [Papilio xuthus]|uniref:Ecdysteroid UDP-glucosyltransferase n=1 Tax=Papilio xuthus TaxID=66420 RepID=A0A0N1IB34_PAPXU|nr:Ecdysteroid UDP-glucosyltransferase [Papilio xuthus]